MKRMHLWILLGMFAAEAFAGQYTIEKFEGEDAGDPDTYIAAEFSNQLKKANPNQIQDGRFYVRQKFEDPFGEDASTYQIYEGRATPARNKLGKFSLSEVSYAELIKAKFFLNRGSSGDDDIEKVYFDGKSVFVEGEDPIFASINGKMTELKPSIEREYSISLSSQPASAEVKIAGVRKGLTPLDFTVNTTRPVLVSVSKAGFYTTFKLIKANPGKTLQEGVLLNPKKDLENPVNALRAKLLEAKKKNDSKAMAALQKTVEQKVANYATEYTKAIDEILAKYPPCPPKSSDENPDEFNSRKTAWEDDRNSEKSKLESAAQSFDAALQDLLKEIEAAISGESFSLRYIYVPNTSLTFGSMGIKDFVVNVDNNSADLNLSYYNAKVAYGSIPKSQLVAEKEKIHAVAKVWNVATESGKYASFYEMAFFYEETPLTLLSKGAFSSTDATSDSENKSKEFSAKLGSLANRGEWNTKDTQATLAALQTGSTPTEAVAVATPAPEPVADESNEEEDSDSSYTSDADSAQLSSTTDESEEEDYSTTDAESDVSERFGDTDEYIRWAAWGLVGTAVVTGVIGVMETMKYNEAKGDYDKTDSKITEIKDQIAATCATNSDPDNCVKAMITYASQAPTDDNNRPLYYLNNYQDQNQSAMDSYNGSRILWLSLSAASIAGSVVLFTW